MFVWNETLSRDLYREFAGRGVIITGVGDGNIGAALADAFHWLGARIALLGNDERSARAALRDRLGKREAGDFQLYPALRSCAAISPWSPNVARGAGGFIRRHRLALCFHQLHGAATAV